MIKISNNTLKLDRTNERMILNFFLRTLVILDTYRMFTKLVRIPLRNICIVYKEMLLKIINFFHTIRKIPSNEV